MIDYLLLSKQSIEIILINNFRNKNGEQIQLNGGVSAPLLEQIVFSEQTLQKPSFKRTQPRPEEQRRQHHRQSSCGHAHQSRQGLRFDWICTKQSNKQTFQ
jgi:hypothetical protein